MEQKQVDGSGTFEDGFSEKGGKPMSKKLDMHPDAVQARKDMARVQADKVLARRLAEQERRLAEEERFSRAANSRNTEVRIHMNKWKEVPEEFTDDSANSARMRMIVKLNNKE